MRSACGVFQRGCDDDDLDPSPAASEPSRRHRHWRRRASPAQRDIIRHAVWLYLRFTLSFRDAEDLLAERGLDVSYDYETIRRWVLKFGPLFARELRRRRPRPTSKWHLDEMAVLIGGRRFWLWRAVDDEGEVLDLLVQRRRDARAAARLMRTLLKKQGFAPETLVTDMTSCAPMDRPRRNWAYRLAMSRACAGIVWFMRKNGSQGLELR